MLRRLFSRSALCGYGLAVNILLPSTVASSTSENLEPVSQSSLMQATIARLPDKATPYGFRGRSSPNLHHLRGSQMGRSETVPSSANVPIRISVAASPAYEESLIALEAVCPGAPTEDRYFHVADWFMEQAEKTNIETMPRSLLEAVYFSVSNLPSSQQKTNVLTLLNSHIPDSPEFISFLSEKRNELRSILEQDAHLAAAREAWNYADTDYRQKTLSYIAGLTLQTLLPNKNIDYPEVIIVRDGSLGQAGSNQINALYASRYNEIYVNNEIHKLHEDYVYASEMVIHETFHAFESILAKWYAEGEIHNPSLNRQARFYYINGLAEGAYVRATENYTGYRIGFNERGSWSFQLAARKAHEHDDIATDMFIDRSTDNHRHLADVPVYRHLHAGRLPITCREEPAASFS